MTKLSEKDVITIFSSALGIADLDDVAAVSLGKKTLAFKCDMLVGMTDVPQQMTPRQAARKSIVACASDLAAKGAQPLAALISLGLPKTVTRGYVEELARGFQMASNEFGIKIVGGDTNEASDLVIDCSMMGIADRIPPRSGARPGDAVVMSGLFGYPASGLAILMGGARATGQFRKSAVDSVLEPLPRHDFAIFARFFTSSIDSSDGLATSLYEIAAQSKVDIQIDYDKVRAEGVDEFAQANNLDPHNLVFFGGEEYEIVATIPRKWLPKARALAKKSGVVLYEVGVVKKGSGKVYDRNSLLENRGYQHLG
jgi:thiamine-monophosphate kinase